MFVIRNPPHFNYFNLMVLFIDCFFNILFFLASHMHIQRKQNRWKRKKKSWKWKLRPIVTLSLLSLSFTTRYHHTVPVDTDSESIGVDNRATACISHKIDDFIGELHDSNLVIIGYNGSRTANLKTGTIRWNWTDDQGVTHTHIIPNSFYSPSGGVRLLSPQH